MLNTVFPVSCIKMKPRVHCTNAMEPEMMAKFLEPHFESVLPLSKQTEFFIPSERSSVFLGKLLVTHLDKLENCYCVHKSPPLDHILGELNPTFFSYHVLKAVFIPFASRSDGFPTTNLYAFLIVPMNVGGTK